MATTGLSLRSILFIVMQLVIVTRPSSCFERFGWMEGEPCDSIPFPFGTHGRALPGFELSCHSGEAYLLPSNNQSYLIRAINTNTVSVSVGSIYIRCYNDNGSEIIEDNSSLLNLVGTPYTISTRENVLVLVGCDDLLKINVTDQGYSRQSGCAAFCESPGNNILLNIYDCSGLGCCAAALPSDGMKSFNLEFKRITNSTNGRFANCSISFIAEQISAGFIGYIFWEEINDSSYLRYKEKKHYPYIQTLTLEWAIGNQICEEARNQSESYLCTNNSDCSDSQYRSFGGYYCNCSQGFQGNPYVLGGCTGTYIFHA